MLRFLAGFATALVVLAVVAVLLIFSGAYDVAAALPHADIEFTILHTIMRNSVVARAPAESLETWSEEAVRHGFKDYDESCCAGKGAQAYQ